MNWVSREISTFSPFSLLRSGLNCIRQGRYADGVAFFALARERLAPDQMQLAAVLDTFISGYRSYWQAQQVLQQASKHFAEVDAEQQVQIAVLEKLLPTSMRDRDTNLNEDSEALPALDITCFGRFEVRRLGQPIVLCSNRNGQAILRYLVAQPERYATMDMLMEVLWPEDEPEVAHHKLQVAASALRRSLNRGYAPDAGGGYILCKNRGYQLNPLVMLRTDADEFLELYQAGQQSSGSAMAAHYERACNLYTGTFLSEELYADWSFIQRDQLCRTYLAMCSALAEHYLEAGRYEDAVKWTTEILKENRCDEAAHRQLMRAYAALGRRSDALRQYQSCVRILDDELGAQPMPETVKLFHAILKSENILNDGTKIERS